MAQNPSSSPVAGNTFHLNKALFIIGFFLLLVLIPLGFYLIKKNQPVSSPQTPEESISLEKESEPIYQFTGQIESINQSSMVISDTIIRVSPLPDIGKDPLAHPPESKKISFTVQVASNTRIINSPTEILPMGKTSTLDIPFSMLKVGQRVTVNSKKDLRFVPNGQFEADSITVLPGVTSLFGEVEEVSALSLTVKSGPPSVAEAKSYKFELDNKVQFLKPSTSTSSAQPNRQASLNDIRTGSQVLIYTDVDLNLFPNPKVIKIEIIPDNP